MADSREGELSPQTTQAAMRIDQLNEHNKWPTWLSSIFQSNPYSQTLFFSVQPTHKSQTLLLPSNEQLHRATGMNDSDYYKDLGVTEYASTEEIKSAFYALAKQYHPDKAGTNDGIDFRRVREAYDVLSDPVSRAAYDGDYQNTHTRTAQYEAEEGAKTGKYDHDHGPERADTYEGHSQHQKRAFHFFF